MAYTKKRITVKVTYSDNNVWYKKGDICEVGAYLTYHYHGDNKPHYEMQKGFRGISVYHCKPIKEIKK